MRFIYQLSGVKLRTMKKVTQEEVKEYFKSIDRNEITNLMKGEKTGEYFITPEELTDFTNQKIEERTKELEEAMKELWEIGHCKMTEANAEKLRRIKQHFNP